MSPYLILSSASEALEINSRRKISLLLYCEGEENGEGHKQTMGILKER